MSIRSEPVDGLLSGPRTKRRAAPYPVWTTLPAFAFFLVLFVYPIGQMLASSVIGAHGLTAKLYTDMLTQRVYAQVLWATFRISLVVTLLCLILGYPVAYVASTVSPRVRNLILGAAVLPFMLDFLVRSYSWMILLGRFGVVNKLLLQLGLIHAPLKLLYNSFGVYVGMVQIQLPLMILTLYSAMQGIDRSLVRAANISGANSVRAWFHVFLPLSLPGVVAGLLLTFVTSLGFFITPALLGGQKDTMIAQWIVVLVNRILDWQGAAALSVLLLAVTLIVLGIYNWAFGTEQLWGGTHER